MISAVGSNIAIPQAAQTIEGKVKTLLPGLIDAPIHLGVINGEPFLQDALTFGVTCPTEKS